MAQGIYGKTILIAAVMSCLAVSAPIKRAVKTKPKITKTKKKPPVAPIPVEPPPKQESSRLFVDAAFGVSRWRGLGFFSGLGFGLFPPEGSRLSWSVQGQLLLLSSGSIFSILAGPTYYFSNPRVSEKFGSFSVLAGAGFPGGGLPDPKTLSIGVFELAGHKRVSDTVVIKLGIRAGLLDEKAAAQLGISLLFQTK